MSLSLDTNNLNDPSSLVIPETKRRRPWGILLFLSVVAGLGGWAWATSFRPARLWSGTPKQLITLEIDRGDLSLLVTENGTLESSDNATVRCEVEALIGLTGGATGGAQGARAGGSGGGQGGGGANGAGGAATPAPAQTAAPAATKKSGGGGGGAAAKKKATGGKAKATGAGVASATDAAASGASGSATGTAASSTDSALLKRPSVSSFNYIVEPHVPLRGANGAKSSSTSTQAKAAAAQQQNAGGGGGGGRGGRGGGGGGGRGGNNQTQEMPGSTRIIWILPEGSPVKAGDIVCELDASAFKDELQAQKIRYLQAKAWVEQAKSILEVNEISLREFEQGIYPQDVQLIRQYISACETEYSRAKGNLTWSRDTAKKGFRSQAQVNADELASQQAEIALREAEGMLDRLENFTGKRIEKARKAKIEAIRADQLSLQSSFVLEEERLKRLEKMVEKCTLRSPRDGIVVYANQANSWGQVESQIQEGVTVRQSQPIFSVPNPKHMQVKAKINESKVAQIQSGQAATIRVDAFPDRLLRGKVLDITAIPAPANGPVSDVRIYYAMVQILSGEFEGLRPGLSAEVNFEITTEQDVTRVPVETLVWVGSQPFAALQLPNPTDQGTNWQWKPLKLGLSDSQYAEVLSGLKPGDHVIAAPDALAPPRGEGLQAGGKIKLSHISG